MTDLRVKLLAYGLAVALLAGIGGAVGAWLASRHYRPLLDTANAYLVTCTAARGNLESLATEQGQKLGELVLQANQRQADAARAVAQARVEAEGDYAAANRLQQERTGGDQCAAATSVIDKELGL